MVAVVAPEGRVAIAVDLGATYLRIAAGTWDGRILRKVKLRTPRGGDGRAVVDAIVRVVRGELRGYLERAEGVAVASVGPLDLRRGRVVRPANLPFEQLELVGPLEEELGKPVLLVNDAVAAAWGEKIRGAARGCENVVYVTLSTGIGVGAVVDGRLLTGKDGNAHEAGHIVVDYRSRIRCGCGGVGHWEALASGSGIPRYASYLASTSYRGLLARSRLARLIERGELTPEDLFEAARLGDELARAIVDELGRVNAAGVASVVNAYDPEVVVLGGAIALNNPDLVIPPIDGYMSEYLINRRPRLVLAELGDDAGLIGALSLVFGESRR